LDHAVIEEGRRDDMSIPKTRARRASARETKRVAPTFQAAPIVLAGLHNLAKKGRYSRHITVLANCMGHVMVMPDAQVLALYDQALAIAFSASSLEGLESIVLTGMQAAAASSDAMRFELGRSALQAFPPNEKPLSRPILFLDRSAALLTVLSVAEYENARRSILRTRNTFAFERGIGDRVRSFRRPHAMAGDAADGPPPPPPPPPIDRSTCRAIVESTLIIGGTVGSIFFWEAKLGIFSIDTATRLLSLRPIGIMISRIGPSKVIAGGVG
jgi:hypothetical protein